MTQISFQRFVILISTDVLREILRDIAENLGKRGIPRMVEDNKVSSPNWENPSDDANSEPRKSCRNSVLLFRKEFWKADGRVSKASYRRIRTRITSRNMWKAIGVN